MSGIAGLWNLDGRPVSESELARMSAKLEHRGPDGEGRRTVGRVGFAHRRMWVTPEEFGEIQPLVGRSGAMLMMDGRIDNRSELLAALRLPRPVSDAASVLAAYEAWGEAFAGRLNGDFAVAVFDPRQPRLVLVRDTIGMRSLYYFRNDRLFAFASEIKGLLAHPDVPLRPDDDGLADFLMLGARPMDRQDVTCFAGISALVPAHVAIVTPTGATTHRYWDFDTGRALRLGSFDEYAEAFREHFAEAVRRRTRSRSGVAVSVSGGLDSSSVFCQAEQLRRAGEAAASLVGVSYTGAAGTEADERRYLEDIEREYGVRIARIPIEPVLGLADGAEEQVRTIEAPFLDYMWGATRGVHQHAREAGARVLLSGQWGDQVLFSSAYLVDLFRALAWRELARHTREYRHWLGAAGARELKRRFALDLVRHFTPRPLVPPLKWVRRHLFGAERRRPWFSVRFRRKGLRFANRPATLGDGFHSVQARSLYVEARSKYHVHCMEWNAKTAARFGLDAAIPFMDRDLVAFLMSVPGEIQNRDGVPRALLRAAMRGVLPESVRQRRWKADFTTLANTGVERDFALICRAVTGDSLGTKAGYVCQERVLEELRRLAPLLQGPDCLATWQVADLFGLEMWLRVFLGDGAARPSGSYHQHQEV